MINSRLNRRLREDNLRGVNKVEHALKTRKKISTILLLISIILFLSLLALPILSVPLTANQFIGIWFLLMMIFGFVAIEYELRKK
jgi:hypothetical protein